MLYSRQMRKAHTLAAVVVAATFLLGGCAPSESAVVPPSEPAVEPVFASDEEALAAATEAYRAYHSLINQIAQDGGQAAERISPVVTDSWLPNELDGFRSLQKSNNRLEGEMTVGETTLQQYISEPGGVTVVTIYACLVPKGVRLVDVEGNDVSPQGLSTSLPREATFESDGLNPAVLLLANDETWPGGSGC